MSLSSKDIRHVANLARLELDDAAVEKFVEQIGTVLEYVEKLKQVDTTGVRPTSHAIELTNAFRDDKPRPHLENEDALANAPEQEDGTFVVPKVVG